MELVNSTKKVLVLAPHTDDAELGCGGTMARLLDEGYEVFVAVFSHAEEAVPEGKSKTVIRDEFFDAMKLLGIPKSNLFAYNFPLRKFTCHRQEILDEIIRLAKTICPTWVFLPSSTDIHQDHEVIHCEGIRAFKRVTIWGYELPWNHMAFSSECFMSLSQKHLDKKLEMLSAYRSQTELNRQYFVPEFIRGLAKTRGVQIGEPYAESFEAIRIKL